MGASKVTLSLAEHRLLTDATVILTKNSVIDKICGLFGMLGNQFFESCDSLRQSDPGIFNIHPKVSKGEKHEQLPWIMLDYPRKFDNNEGHLAIRCFCWWGNYFSIQLQVSGKYLSSFLAVLPQWEMLQNQPWYTGLTSDPWHMQLPNSGWLAIDGALRGNDNPYFLKVAKKIPINEWELLEEKLLAYFNDLIDLTQRALRHQSGETIL